MKLSLYSILLISGLAALGANAQTNRQDTAVFYEDSDEVEVKYHEDCIPLRNDNGKNVEEVVFGLQVKCDLYQSTDCSGPAEEEKQKAFEQSIPVTSEYFGYLNSKGSLKCT